MGGSVHGGNRNTVAVRRDGELELLLFQEYGCHSSAGRQGLHQARSRGDQAQAVFETENAGHASRNILSDAVAHNRRRLDSPGPPQLRECVLEGKKRGLGVSRLVDRRSCRVVRIEDLQERLPEFGSKQFVATFEGAAEDRFGLV